MIGLSEVRRVAVIAPHPDDEVLGCGGTIARLADLGISVDVVTVTRGQPPDFDEAGVRAVEIEARAAHALLGVHESHFMALPAARLDTLAQVEVNADLHEVLDTVAPDMLFVPFHGDIHQDHRIVFTAAMVWARPRHAESPTRIWAYETLSETNWFAPGSTPAFLPNCFVDISTTLDRKVASLARFQSQVRSFPDERSIEAVKALATSRGASVFRHAAEAFMVIREVV